MAVKLMRLGILQLDWDIDFKTNKKRLLLTTYKFYWGIGANIKGITYIQGQCTMIMNRFVAPNKTYT